jgi:hypothetical protein
MQSGGAKWLSFRGIALAMSPEPIATVVTDLPLSLRAQRSNPSTGAHPLDCLAALAMTGKAHIIKREPGVWVPGSAKAAPE